MPAFDPVTQKAPEILKIIDESSYYTLNLMSLPDVPQGNVYGVVNKTWGVIEMSSSLLSNAYEFFDELNKWSASKYGEKLPDLGDTTPPGMIS